MEAPEENPFESPRELDPVPKPLDTEPFSPAISAGLFAAWFLCMFISSLHLALNQTNKSTLDGFLCFATFVVGMLLLLAGRNFILLSMMYCFGLSFVSISMAALGNWFSLARGHQISQIILAGSYLVVGVILAYQFQRSLPQDHV